MHAQLYLYVTFGHQGIQAALHICNIRPLKVKNAPTCFDHHSDHLQGACMFRVKVTDFKIW